MYAGEIGKQHQKEPDLLYQTYGLTKIMFQHGRLMLIQICSKI